jgi:hypothetical protein
MFDINTVINEAIAKAVEAHIGTLAERVDILHKQLVEARIALATLQEQVEVNDAATINTCTNLDLNLSRLSDKLLHLDQGSGLDLSSVSFVGAVEAIATQVVKREHEELFSDALYEDAFKRAVHNEFEGYLNSAEGEEMLHDAIDERLDAKDFVPKDEMGTYIERAIEGGDVTLTITASC